MPLIHVDDSGPGIRRRRSGAGFVFVGLDGRVLRDADEIARIRKLAIPPAYRDVWICPDPRGHLQATARDARGRKQYRYHAGWRQWRDAQKFSRMLDFGRALGGVRRAVSRALKRPGLDRERVLALCLAVLDATLIRVGNDEYVKANGSYGLTTLRNRHLRLAGGRVRLRFRGKSGVIHEAQLRDARIARLLRACRELPGQELFQYLDDEGQPHRIGSDDVNEHLRRLSGAEFSAKDWRTWAGSVLAFERLRGIEPAGSLAARRRQLAQTMQEVARRLGNTPAVCRRCYVHPRVIDEFLAGRRLEGGDGNGNGNKGVRGREPPGSAARDGATRSTRRPARLSAAEAAFLHFLQRHADTGDAAPEPVTAPAPKTYRSRRPARSESRCGTSARAAPMSRA